MSDPLAQIITLMRPRALFSKGITGVEPWAVRYEAFGRPGFCVVMEGRCRLAVEGEDTVTLDAGDFVLLPATPAFTMSGLLPATPTLIVPDAAPAPTEERRHGRHGDAPDVRLFGGHVVFDSPDALLLVSLLPRMLHLRGVPQLSVLVRLIRDEAAHDRPGRELVLTRLVDLLLIEALRAMPGKDMPPGLLRGLADLRIAHALRQIHGDLERHWTVADLARAAGMSRSAFFDRFTRIVGQRPMEYLLAWRMAVARDLLRRRDLPLDEVARRVGYGSASTFSIAFSRHVGQPPGRYARGGQSRSPSGGGAT